MCLLGRLGLFSRHGSCKEQHVLFRGLYVCVRGHAWTLCVCCATWLSMCCAGDGKFYGVLQNPTRSSATAAFLSLVRCLCLPVCFSRHFLWLGGLGSSQLTRFPLVV
jgi:hypothetical protein